MRAHPDVIDVQLAGCRTLAAATTEDNAQRIAEAGAALRVVNALRRHPDHVELSSRACLALDKSAASEEARAAVISAGAISQLLRAMKATYSCSWYNRSWVIERQLEVKRNACMAVFRLAQSRRLTLSWS